MEDLFVLKVGTERWGCGMSFILFNGWVVDGGEERCLGASRTPVSTDKDSLVSSRLVTSSTGHDRPHDVTPTRGRKDVKDGPSVR